jgi:TonB-dependent receptor
VKKITYQFLLQLALIITATTTVLAQTGKISGKITDKKTNETLIGASVSLQGSTKGAATNVNGQFIISNLAPGTYTLVVKYIGYQTKSISDIAVTDSKVADVNIVLEEATTQALKEVVIKASYKQESATALYAQQKNNAAITDGISSETIKRSPDRSTSDVLKRVSGATIQDNRFVIIRGLSDRYNTALLDNSPLPSTEANRKAFSFDIVPSALIDNLIISKTATPNLPGDFAGGAVQIVTRDIPDANFTNISIGYTYNTQSTFKDFKSGYRNPSDYFGFDDGSRQLPTNFPSSAKVLSSGLTAEQNISAVKSLNRNYNILNWNAMPAQNYQVSLGRVKDIGKNGNRLGALLAITYRNGQQTSLDARRDFYVYDFHDDLYKFSTNLGAVANFGYNFGKNKITFKNIYNRTFDDQFTYRTGTNTGNSSDVRFYAFDLTEKSLLKSTLEGEHRLGSRNSTIRWTAGYSNILNDQPDQRKIGYGRNLSDVANNPETPYNANVTSLGKENTRLFSYLNEDIYSGEVNYSLPVTLFKQSATFKTGLSTQYRKRNFDIRYIGLNLDETASDFNDIRQRPLSKLFASDLVNAGKYKLRELASTTDKYDANSMINAGYAMLDNKFGEKFRLVWGVRVEKFNLDLESKDPSQPKVNLDNLDILPSANFTYSVTPKANLRLSYYRTLARPEFRELATFAYYDYEQLNTISGNPKLVRSNLNNADIRYEFYPTAGQIFSVSAFYKNFKNAIEPYIDGKLSTPDVSYFNAKNANVYGIELEARKTLEFINSNAAFKNTTFYTNLSLIKSKVTDDLVVGDSRPLSGQSPYVINAGLMHSEFNNKLTVNFLFNRIGDRIYRVRDDNFPSVLEAPRNVFDMQIGYKAFKNKGEFKLNAGDILNNRYLFYMDYDGNKKYSDGDRIYSQIKPGSNITLSFNYSF